MDGADLRGAGDRLTGARGQRPGGSELGQSKDVFVWYLQCETEVKCTRFPVVCNETHLLGLSLFLSQHNSGQEDPCVCCDWATKYISGELNTAALPWLAAPSVNALRTPAFLWLWGPSTPVTLIVTCLPSCLKEGAPALLTTPAGACLAFVSGCLY